MYEWVHGANSFKGDHFKAHYPSQQDLADIFDLARNITNGTKHLIPKTKTRSQKGFSSGFRAGFARPLIIKRSGGNEISADDLLSQMLTFWKEQEGKGAF
jgi:hypothetical protein